MEENGSERGLTVILKNQNFALQGEIPLKEEIAQ